jgi:hypothetical protein
MDYGNKYCPKESARQDRGMKLVGGAFPLLEKIVIITTHCKYFFSFSIENKVVINYRPKVCKIFCV